MAEHSIDKLTEILERYGVIITDELNHEIRGIFINPDVVYKVCRCCKIEVPLTEYERLPNKKNGDKSYRALCKICMKEKRKQYYIKYNEKRRKQYKEEKEKKKIKKIMSYM